MYERIKLIRKSVNLNQSEFGKSIGISRDTVANIEGNRIEIKDIFIKSICKAFNVNEDWLRNGTGDMFISTDNMSLDDLVKDCDPIELDILRAYFSLDKDIRQKVIQHFRSCLNDE